MSQYFYEDQVYTIDKKGNVKFGLVVENEVSFREFSGIINFPLPAPVGSAFLVIDKTEHSI